MKTALQELMDYLNADAFTGICDIRDRVEELFEKEKQQIIDAHLEGWSDAYDYLRDEAPVARQAEEYYSQTYKQYGLDDEARQILNNL